MIKKIIILFQITLLVSCFQPFEEDLYEDSDPSIVIEARMNNIDKFCHVMVSKSVKPDNESSSDPVNNAVVFLRDFYDNTEKLNWFGSGIYISNEIIGVPNDYYYISIEVEGKEYFAIDKMPDLPELDSSNVYYRSNYMAGSGYYLSLYMRKRPDTISYYKINITVNDSLLNDYTDLLVFNDAYALKKYEIVLPYSFELDDSLSVDVHGISKEMYNYYYGLNKQTTNLFSNIQPPMLNPPSNFSNSSLGYFQASSIVRINEVIKEEDIKK